jgi:DNA primase
MSRFTKESLERLKANIDLVELLSAHIELKRAGSTYKALCPFHQEKNPSFVVQRGDSHYHCFGCGAHGDAIQFLMEYQRLTFVEAVEALGSRFNTSLEKEEGEGPGPDRAALKSALAAAAELYHKILLQTEEGGVAMRYLQERGLDLEFVKRFQVGWAPAQTILRQGLKEHLPHLKTTGLVRDRGDFFEERILFPIRDGTGSVIGFSGRKIKESTFGGKYINTPETPLFRKSRTLYGLNYCRRRIAKERKALIVEGQIDALRLIHAGFDFAVAGQGTAFGEGQVALLVQLGVRQVYLAFDADRAGREAAIKVGDLFLKKGVEPLILPIPEGSDPDSLLTAGGPAAIERLLADPTDYLTFLVRELRREIDIGTPAGKAELVRIAKQRIASWDDPVLIYESLRRLAQLLQIPEEMVGIEPQRVTMRRTGVPGGLQIDPDRIMEADCLRWILAMGKEYVDFASAHLTSDHFRTAELRTLFDHIEKGGDLDPLSLSIATEQAEVISELLEKKINKEKGTSLFPKVIQRLLERNWMEERDAIQQRIQSGASGDEEALELARQFNALKRPEVTWTT